MKRKLLIIGAKGHGRVVADIALKTNRWHCISFLDDNEELIPSMGIEVIGKVKDVLKFSNDCDVVVAIGCNETRKRIQEKLKKEFNISIPTLVHPNAIIGGQVKIGEGTVIMGGVVINCGTTIGSGCIINTGATVDHDSFIEDYVHISPGVHLAGTVKVGECTWLGIGSIVINNISITSGCKIGAGAVVIRDINETGIYVGIPSRRL